MRTGVGFVAAAAALALLAPGAIARADAGADDSQDVLRATLDNGLRVVIVRDPIAPVVTTEVNYLAGSDETPTDFPGMAHAQEHMMFRGSSGLSGDQLTAITADLGGDVNADTEPTVTQFHFTVPADDLEVALRVEASRMRDVDDSEEQWDRERGAIEQEVSMDESSPLYLANRAIIDAAFAGTPYARDGLGTRASFDKTTGPMLKSFYDAWYAPNDAVMVVAGDVDPPTTLTLVKSLFESIPRKRLPARPAVVLQPLHDAQAVVDANFAFPITLVSYRLPGYESKDFIAGQVLVDVLQSKRGPLAELALNGKAIAATFAGIALLPAAGLGTAIGIAAPGNGRESLSDEMESVLAGYAEHGVPADLVDAAKRHEQLQADEYRSSIPLVARAWSEAVAIAGMDTPDDQAQIDAVTTADVDRVAKIYLARDQAITCVVHAMRSSGSGDAGGGQAESFAPTASAPVALPAWAQQKLSSLPTLAAQPIADDRTLPNGVRVIVVPDTTTSSIAIFGDVKNSPQVEAPQGQDGVSEVESDLFAYGTSSMERDKFQAALDSIGADESGGTRFSLHVLADDLDRGMQLLSANELSPAFPASAFAIVQQQEEGVAAGRHRSADYQVQQALDRGLYPLFDPALRDTTPDTVAGLSLDDVKDYYKKTFRPDLTTVVVIGDVTVDQADSEVEKWFGGWSTYVPPPSVDLPAVPNNEAASSVFSPVGALQDVVSMSETVGIVRSNKDYYALNLGTEVLGGATLASRLYTDLRRDRGLVYYVQTSLDVGDTRSTYSIRFGCDPQNVSRATEVLRRDLLTMQTVPVSDAELERTKSLLIRQIPLAEAGEDEIARGILDRAESGLPLDEPSQAAAAYASLTPADVTAAFAHWIRPDGFVQVVEGPYPQ